MIMTQNEVAQGKVYSRDISIDRSTTFRLVAYSLTALFVAAALVGQITGSGNVTIGVFDAVSIIFVPFVILFLHEAIHGLFFKLFGGNPRYGIGLMYGILPYAYATSEGLQLTLWRMTVVGLAPLTLISLVSLGLISFLPTTFAMALSLAFITNCAGSVGDIWLISQTFRFRKIEDLRVIDRADAIRLESSDSQLVRIVSAATNRRSSGVRTFFRFWFVSAIALFVACWLFAGALFLSGTTSPVTLGVNGLYLLSVTPTTNGHEILVNLLAVLLIGLFFAMLLTIVRRRLKKA